MELEIKILNGTRQGMYFTLPIGPLADGVTMPYVLETEALAFFARVGHACETLSLCTGERTLPFTPGRSGQPDEFELFPAYLEGSRREALFFNYFGVAQLSLKIEVGGQAQYIDTAPLEVLARKATATQAESMVSFILAQTQDDLCEHSNTSRFQSGTAGRSEQLNQLVTQLRDNIQTFAEIMPHLIARPIRALTSDLALRSGSLAEVQSDQGTAWLAENLSVLEETNDQSRSHILIDGRLYQATELLTPVVREHTDIYENQVLLGHLETLWRFTSDLLEHFTPTSSRHNTHVGYVSFFACMKDWIHQVSSQQLSAIKQCQEQLAVLRRQFIKYLPVRKSDDSIPRITAKIRGNRNYLTLFRMIIQWHRGSRLDWNPQQIFLAINSMPDLFEYYSLSRIRQWLLSKGQPTGPKSLSQSQWQTRINNLELNLSYEPIFWMVGNSRAEQIINIENRSADEAKNNWVGRRREYEYARRSPDFTIEVRRENELLGLLVMDAKYTTMDLAFKHYLPECTMKYVHGIARADAKTDDKGIVKAMVILYADRFDAFMDFHAAPYDAYGEKTQLPILGVQALSLKSPDQADMRSLEMLLDRMLELISLAA